MMARWHGILIVGMIASLAGCYSRTTLVPPIPPAIEGDLAAVILDDGERVSLGNTDVELTEAELVVFDRSQSEVRRIPRDDIREVEIVEFRTMRTVLFAVGVVYPLAALIALAASGESAPG